MIKVDESVLEKAELLAKLEMEDSERERTVTEMKRLLDYVEKLNELDTEGVLPLTYGVYAQTRFREDEVTNPDGKEAALFNAPEQRNGQFVVPKTV